MADRSAPIRTNQSRGGGPPPLPSSFPGGGRSGGNDGGGGRGRGRNNNNNNNNQYSHQYRSTTPNRNQHHPPNQHPQSHHRPPPTTQQPSSQPPMPMSGVPYGYLPAFLPGSASLVEQLDRRLMIVLRDGRHLVGILRSFDQFSNMVLEDTSERRILRVAPKSASMLKSKRNGVDDDNDDEIGCYYTDIRLGLYLVRGDSMVLLGEVDDDDDDDDDDDTNGRDVTASSSSAVAEVPSSHNNNNNNNNPMSELTGSGLLMGGGLGGGEMGDHSKRNGTKRFMKKVTLEEFEELSERHGETMGKNTSNGDGAGGPDGQVEQLTWDFDADLVV